jgi:predicted ATPase
LSLLMETEETKKRILFYKDFGCGKTLLMKYFAHVLEKRESLKSGNEKKKIFFISLAAATGQNLTNKQAGMQSLIQSYTRPAVIDVASKFDFKDTEVQVKDQCNKQS